MKNNTIAASALQKTLIAAVCALGLWPAFSVSQVPVDENGVALGSYQAEPATGNEDIPLLSTVDLEELVGPIALYPDDLLAIVLPAAAYPLQIVDAARFLEALDNDPSLEPDPDWDESVVALLNYPEVIELLNDDIDWTWRLGEAVVAQQADVIAAVETFRDRAYAAGNLKSDSYQNVSRNGSVIEITPVAEDEIYVPYYEPEHVVVYQPRPVYYYYPRPYPVYYYPYSSAYAFDRRYFWGVTTAFTIGWYSDSLNVFHHSYFGHPYYGRSYWDRWWYRRPSLNIHNTTYIGNNTRVTVNRYDDGDRWRPRIDRRDYARENRFTRNREYPRQAPRRLGDSQAKQANVRGNARRPAIPGDARLRTGKRQERNREPIVFRERAQTGTPYRTTTSSRREAASGVARRNTDAAARKRSDAARRTTEDRAQRRTVRESTERRTTPAARPRRAETALPERRVKAAARSDQAARVRPAESRRTTAKRAAPEPQVRRAKAARSEAVGTRPAPQARSAAPARSASRPEAQRQQKVERSSAKPAQARQSGTKKSARTSRRRQ